MSAINVLTVPTGGVSDPEGDFLMTLTKREKKLLLKKLEVNSL